MKGTYMMEPATYLVIRIDGDYAHLQRIDETDAAVIPVARALLPEDIREGTKLYREFLEYTLL